MKKLIILSAMLVGMITSYAQTVIDNFNVGPYIVDYNGQGDVKYRLRDNIDLYEFFELKNDTIVLTPQENIVPVKHAIQLNAVLGAAIYTTKEFGIEGLWKQNIDKNLYFNGGLSFLFDYTKTNGGVGQRSTFELGLPLQIEWCNLNKQKATFYGLVGVAPTYYTSLQAKEGRGKYDGIKKSGFMFAPSLEIGGNIPVGNVILRLGAYGKYKINCSNSEFNLYSTSVGCAYIGGKICIII